MIGFAPSMDFDAYISSLERELTNGSLPGLAAQMRLSPTGRIDHDYEAAPKGARRSAVLIALFDGESAGGGRSRGETARDVRAGGLSAVESRSAGASPPGHFSPAFPAIVRTEDGRPHSGQIGLPGGATEEGDEFPTGTALREAHEEIGISPESVRVLGALTPLYIPVSNYTMTPVVAVVGDRRPPAYLPDPREVADIITVRLDRLSAGVSSALFETIHGPIEAPCYELSDGAQSTLRIWGATAMVLSELVECHRRVCS